MSKLIQGNHLQKVKNFILKRSYPLILLMICILSYGLLLPFIGYYLDDWYLIWFKHVFGALDYIKYFSLDRPLMGYFYIVANFILGGSEIPLVWQIFGVFTRWLSVIALWQMLNTIWPEAKRQNICVALLAAVFPGFTQQWIAVIYSFFFTCLAGFFFSVSLMLKAIRSSKRFWWYYVCSILIMAYVIPASEFFFGLEFIRLLILWFEFNKNEHRIAKCFKKIGICDFPYAVVMFLFLIWRVFFFKSSNHALALDNLIKQGIGKAILQNLTYLYQSIVTAVINTWSNPFNIENYPSGGATSLAIIGLVTLVFVIMFIWLRMVQSEPGKKEPITIWQKQAPVLGLASVVLAILPFWAANLPIDNKFPFDRFLLAFLFGSCLLIVWLFESLGHNDMKMILVIACLVSIGVGYQTANANRYKNLWDFQTRFFWQLNWRMPDLEPKTMLLAYQLPETEYWTGMAVSSFLNWAYANSVVDRRIDYHFIIINSGQKLDIPNLIPNQPVKISFRTFSFEGNTSQAIFVYFSTDGCLRVLDSKITPPETVLDGLSPANENFDNPQIVDTISGAKLTNLNLIKPGNGGHPPVHIIGATPKKDWCYYFEKAEFARQEQDYPQVISLYKEASNNQLTPLDQTESYPFIDSFARTGDWGTAEKMTSDLMPVTRQSLQAGLCHLWKTLASVFPDQQSATRVISDLNCP
jgi:hypothetical protein